ncbi:MAG: hypothetical protein ACO1SV_04285 [Fimbriimonas sp.]
MGILPLLFLAPPLRLNLEIVRIERPNAEAEARQRARIALGYRFYLDRKQWTQAQVDAEVEREMATDPTRIGRTTKTFATLHQDGVRILIREYETIDGKRSPTPWRVRLYDGRSTLTYSGDLLMHWRGRAVGALEPLPILDLRLAGVRAIKLSPSVVPVTRTVFAAPVLSPFWRGEPRYLPGGAVGSRQAGEVRLERLWVGASEAPSEEWSFGDYAPIGGRVLPTRIVHRQDGIGRQEIHFRILPMLPEPATPADFDFRTHGRGIKVVDFGEGDFHTPLYRYDPKYPTVEAMRSGQRVLG